MSNIERNGMNYWDRRLRTLDHSEDVVPELGVPFRVGNLIVTCTSDFIATAKVEIGR